MKEIVGHGKTQHDIAKVFHALVVDMIVANIFRGHRLMCESNTIQSNIFRTETENIVNVLGECFFLRVFKTRKKRHLRIQTF